MHVYVVIVGVGRGGKEILRRKDKYLWKIYRTLYIIQDANIYSEVFQEEFKEVTYPYSTSQESCVGHLGPQNIGNMFQVCLVLIDPATIWPTPRGMPSNY